MLPLLELKKLDRWDARRPRICTVCRAVRAWVLRRAQAATACLYLHPHACLRHGARQWLLGGECAAVRPLVRPARVVGHVRMPGVLLEGPGCEIARDIASRDGGHFGSLLDWGGHWVMPSI